MKNIHVRQTNFELLRIISMAMIISLHYLGKGEILNNVHIGTTSYYFAWIIESGCYIAVNCYVLITGYFMINSQFKLEKLLMLWLQVVFVMVGSYLILCICGMADFNIKEFISNFFPITLEKYWFVTVYFQLYLLSPILNIIIKMFERQQLKKVIFLMLIFDTICL